MRLWQGVLGAGLAALVSPARAATVETVYTDAAGVGFFDPTPATPVGGNTGTTLGEQRRLAVEHALSIWAARLQGTVPIKAELSFGNTDMGCTQFGAVLASAGARSYTLHTGASRSPHPVQGVLYPAALYNQFAGYDVNPGANDLQIKFNSRVGQTGCSELSSWYYGLDGKPPVRGIDVVTVTLHELAHGLGFSTLMNASTGGFPSLAGAPRLDTYATRLYDATQGKAWTNLTDAERLVSAKNSGNLLWNGPAVLGAAAGFPGPSGCTGDGGRVRMFAPSTYQGGSSVSHFDSTCHTPNLVMEPSYGSGQTLDLTPAAFSDIGWTLKGTCGDGALDAGELCDQGSRTGTAAACCTSVCTVRPAGYMCAVPGACDVAEACTGTSGACPNMLVAAAGTPCRASAGDCDIAESCTGTDPACPTDTFQPAGTVCRASMQICGAAETCTGTSATCPADAPAPDGSTCSDANACTMGDACTAGQCGSGAAVSCDDGNPCTTDACAPETGCTHVPVMDGSTCSDGNACTAMDVCMAGKCVGGLGPSCDDGNPCTTDSCAPVGGCQHVPVADGQACSDGNACTMMDVCKAGVCAAGAARACDDNNACTADSCAPSSGCVNVPVTDGSACSDGNACTATDLCTAGQCTPGAARTCDDGNVCTSDTCAPAVGCQHAPVTNGQTCSDGNVCTSNDACQMGVCTAGAPLSCDDGDPCTADVCTPAGGCGHAPSSGASCDDKNPCTRADTCQAGSCVGTAIVCTAPGECYQPGVCSAAAGLCVPLQKPDGTPCSAGVCEQGNCRPVAMTPDAAPPEADAAAPDAAPPDAGIDGGAVDASADGPPDVPVVWPEPDMGVPPPPDARLAADTFLPSPDAGTPRDAATVPQDTSPATPDMTIAPVLPDAAIILPIGEDASPGHGFDALPEPLWPDTGVDGPDAAPGLAADAASGERASPQPPDAQVTSPELARANGCDCTTGGRGDGAGGLVVVGALGLSILRRRRRRRSQGRAGPQT